MIVKKYRLNLGERNIWARGDNKWLTKEERKYSDSHVFAHWSNLGRIRNSKSIGKKECLKTKVTKNGYEEVSVSIDGKPYTKSVHRLVAITFLENPENKPEVDHIDSNKLNNRADNLRWATREENLQNDLYYGNKMKRMLSQGFIKKLIVEKQAKITKLQQEIEALKTQLEDEI